MARRRGAGDAARWSAGPPGRALPRPVRRSRRRAVAGHRPGPRPHRGWARDGDLPRPRRPGLRRRPVARGRPGWHLVGRDGGRPGATAQGRRLRTIAGRRAQGRQGAPAGPRRQRLGWDARRPAARARRSPRPRRPRRRARRRARLRPRRGRGGEPVGRHGGGRARPPAQWPGDRLRGGAGPDARGRMDGARRTRRLHLERHGRRRAQPPAAGRAPRLPTRPSPARTSTPSSRTGRGPSGSPRGRTACVAWRDDAPAV